MKAYVATRYGNAAAASALMRRLEGMGYSITVDWTDPSLTGREAELGLPETLAEGRVPEGEALDVASEMAAMDIRGVVEADVFFLIIVDEMKGAWIELGAALSHGIPSFVIAPEGQRIPIFSFHPNAFLCRTEDEAIARVLAEVTNS